MLLFRVINLTVTYALKVTFFSEHTVQKYVIIVATCIGLSVSRRWIVRRWWMLMHHVCRTLTWTVVRRVCLMALAPINTQ